MKRTLVSLILLLSVLAVSLSEKARFDNYRVYTVDVETQDQLSVLRELSATSDAYEFWDTPVAVKSKVQVIVPPHKFAHFVELKEKFGFNMKLTNNNLQETMDEERPKKQGKAAEDMNWDDYQSVATIYDWIESLRLEFPNWITIEEIGYSYEGRPIKVVKLSKNPAQNNRVIFIEANIHAREWIASATSTWVLNQLLRSTDPEVMSIANNVDWYILPQANPDGYEYTRSSNRNWRKTRSPVSLICDGVDPNRNFAFNWLIKDETGNEGASRAPCSDTYAGPHPFSENETIAINSVFLKYRDQIDVFISLHSYAHMILFPMGHTQTRVENYEELQAVGDSTAAGILQVHGIEYEVGNSKEVLYASSGSSPDQAYGVHGIKLAYTIEMRGEGAYGDYGFFLPPQFIIPNAEEILQGLVSLVQRAQDIGYLRQAN